MKKYWYLLIAVLFLSAGCATDNEQPTSFQMVKKITPMFESLDLDMYEVEDSGDKSHVYVYAGFWRWPSSQWYGISDYDGTPIWYTDLESGLTLNNIFLCDYTVFFNVLSSYAAYDNNGIPMALTNTTYGYPPNWDTFIQSNVNIEMIKLVSLDVNLDTGEEEVGASFGIDREFGLDYYELMFYNENETTWEIVLQEQVNSNDQWVGESRGFGTDTYSIALINYLETDPAYVDFALRGTDNDEETFVHTEMRDRIGLP